MGLFSFFGSAPSDAEAKDAEPVESDKAASAKVQSAAEKREPPRFDAVGVLEAAGVDAKQRERVDRTLELLAALPADASPQLRKNIVEASLKAFDISIKAIVESANSEISAFDAFIAEGHAKLDELQKQSHARIAELEAEIAKIKERLELATADQESLDHATGSAIDRVRPVLGFFSVAPPAPKSGEQPVNDTKAEHPPSIIVDEDLLKTG